MKPAVEERVIENLLVVTGAIIIEDLLEEMLADNQNVTTYPIFEVETDVVNCEILFLFRHFEANLVHDLE